MAIDLRAAYESSKAAYASYSDARKAYRFTPLDYVTWLSWHLEIPLPELWEKLETLGITEGINVSKGKAV